MQISKPEDWERTPHPKKYFVHFFGTQEISFVAPIDVRPFTHESRNKLMARCKGRTIKYFSQAVREICDRFEELQPKSSDSLKDGSTSAVSTKKQIEHCNDEVTSPKEEGISNSSAGHNKTDVDS